MEKPNENVETIASNNVSETSVQTQEYLIKSDALDFLLREYFSARQDFEYARYKLVSHILVYQKKSQLQSDLSSKLTLLNELGLNI